MSRPLLEHVVRGFVERDHRIEIRPNCRVREIVASADGRCAIAVRGDIDGHAGATLQADLIVDATGRGALTLDFLSSAGCPSPDESSIHVDIRDSCAVFACLRTARAIGRYCRRGRTQAPMVGGQSCFRSRAVSIGFSGLAVSTETRPRTTSKVGRVPFDQARKRFP
jgi:hypothetical protein